MPLFILAVVIFLFLFIGNRLLWKTSIAVVATFAVLGAILGIPEGPPGIISGLIGGIALGVSVNDTLSKL